ncbi:MAG TPA: HesA/MoeB/ThiF family protein [Anaeromyxobacteraceae bacterium]|nr:HesA/MoeB/ThiF family protein [Anaeromyxobacteraceae bacterium]
MSTNLAGKSALVVGAGGLGGPVLLTLASAGAGRLVLVEDDVVETSNLSRQPLFGEADIGQRKVHAAVRRLRRLFPLVEIEALDRRFEESNAGNLARSVDLLVDCSDNFATKFLANDSAVSAGIPLVHGGILRYTAQILTILPGETGCLRCLFEAPPPEASVPSCAEAGVLGPLAGLAGALMGAEAVRLLCGERGFYAGRLLVYEARSGHSRVVPIRVREDCPLCRTAGEARRPALTAGER